MKTAFRSCSFRPDSLRRIEQANEIIEEYAGQGLRLTLRQLYYQFVSRDLIPNTDRSYKNLGNLISDGRLAGLIDWDAIEDRVRVPRRPNEFSGLPALVDAALAGVLTPLASKYHVTLMVNRGYSSQSAMYEAAMRYIANGQNGKLQMRLLYLGDLDPSGEDMVRDIRERLAMFGADVKVTKLALTMEQVELYNPPPNPAKTTDSRAAGFIEKYGASSWEVDALPPNILTQLIEAAFDRLISSLPMALVKEQEAKDKERLRKAVAAIRG